MSALRVMLGDAVEWDAAGFDGEAFADSRFGKVRGRVARRRAARSAGVGGASVLGVGAVAFGAGQVPWSSYVFGAAPGAGTSVVCTTTTPDAVVEEGAAVPEGATFTVVDNATDAAFYLGLVDDAPAVWNVDGSPADVERPSALEATLTLPSGVVVYLERDELYSSAFGADIQDDGAVTIYGAHEFAELGTGPAPTAQAASVTCVTTTPEPSSSPSVTPSTLVSPEPSVSASHDSSAPVNPEWTWDPQVPGDTPFQCGFAFPNRDGSSGLLTIGEPDWLDADDAVAEISAPYDIDGFPGLVVSGDPVPVVTVDIASDWAGLKLSGGSSSQDPMIGSPGYVTGLDRQPVYGGFVIGSQYLLASDGVVVATFDTTLFSGPQFLEDNGEGLDHQRLYGLDLTRGMMACDGVSDSTLADADLVAVAGARLVDNNETVDGPYYAWRFVDRP